jgi:hypothetical protein
VPAVVRFLEKSTLKRSVYMVVGIKTVTGVAVKRAVESGFRAQLDVSVDATLCRRSYIIRPKD